MWVLWPILVTGSHLTLAAAGGVPDLDVGPTCRVAADIGKAGAQAARVCREQERRARETLRRTWQEYAAPARERCSSLARMGGSPSYVALLTCLEMAKIAEALPDIRPGGRRDAVAGR